MTADHKGRNVMGPLGTCVLVLLIAFILVLLALFSALEQIHCALVACDSK